MSLDYATAPIHELYADLQRLTQDEDVLARASALMTGYGQQRGIEGLIGLGGEAAMNVSREKSGVESTRAALRLRMVELHATAAWLDSNTSEAAKAKEKNRPWRIDAQKAPNEVGAE